MIQNTDNWQWHQITFFEYKTAANYNPREWFLRNEFPGNSNTQTWYQIVKESHCQVVIIPTLTIINLYPWVFDSIVERIFRWNSKTLSLWRHSFSKPLRMNSVPKAQCCASQVWKFVIGSIKRPSRVNIPNKTPTITNCVILNHLILLWVLTDAPGILNVCEENRGQEKLFLESYLKWRKPVMLNISKPNNTAQNFIFASSINFVHFEWECSQSTFFKALHSSEIEANWSLTIDPKTFPAVR